MTKDTLGLVGQVIDNLRFDEIVDEGGFGYIYRGRHLGMDEPVAIKCLKIAAIGGADDEYSFASRFRDETRIAYKLSQGNLDIVRSITSGTLDARGAKVPYMVLEWLEGRTLSVDLAARKNGNLPPLTLEETMELLESAAGALAHAHAAGVVHRDIKPSNLFLAETRSGPRVKVLDFGLAKIVDPENFMKPEAAPTASHVYVCSPAYGAPEQFDKKLGSVGAWTDVYSFAFVMMELMSGRKVRDARTLMDGMLKALDPKTASPAPSALGVVVPDAVEKVLLKAVALSPSARWKDAKEFWDALKQATRVAAAASIAPTVQEDLPAGAREAVMRRVEEIQARAAAFSAAHAAGGGKGGTVALDPGASPEPPVGSLRPPPGVGATTTTPPPTPAPSTAPMPHAPPHPASHVPQPSRAPSPAAQTLPLDSRMPSVAPPPLASGSIAPPRPSPPMRDGDPLAPARRPTSAALVVAIAIVVVAIGAVGWWALRSR